MDALSSNSQVADSDIFFQNAPEEEFKSKRHELLVKKALETHDGESIYVDCSTSNQLLMSACGVVPCVTPTHPVFSVRLKRYLLPEEYLRIQGIWPSCYQPDVYKHYVQIGQDIAGNSFTSTVCQAAIIASLVTCPTTWRKLPSKQESNSLDGNPASKAANMVQERIVGQPDYAGSNPSDTVRRRIVGKRKASALYDGKQEGNESKGTPKPRIRGKKKRGAYKRKVAGVDSRKSSKGKKPQVSISQKLKVLPELCCIRLLCVYAVVYAEYIYCITYIYIYQAPGHFVSCKAF